MPRRTRLIEALAAVLATSVLLAAPTAPAAPVADDERGAVDVRRMRLALLRANDDFIELNQLLGTAAGTESR